MSQSLLPSNLQGHAAPRLRIPTDLIIADGAAPDVAGLLQDAILPVVALRECSNPLQAITTVLAGEQLRTLHLFTHGRPGAIRICDQWLTAADLVRHANLLTTWQADEIVLWGCSVMADDSLARTLESLTGATVYGSVTPVGRTNGFQNLEVVPLPDAGTDSKTLSLVLSEAALQQMDFVLADVSVFFTSGYLGTQGRNTNQADNIKTFSTLGIQKIAFVQDDTDNDGLFDEVATQGNDVAGTIKIYQTDGTIHSLTGALNWRETTGSKIEVLGFIFGATQSATITNGASSFIISGGSTSGTSSTLGLKSYVSNFSFTDGQNRSGNAATAGLLQALNDELTNAPQPSTITLTASSVLEGTSLTFTVTMNKAPTSTQYFSLVTGGSATSGSDFNGTYTFSNGVTRNADGTISVPSGVTSFTVSVVTTDDAALEASETLSLQIGNRTGTATILDNDGAYLTYSGSTFNEAVANNGSISTTLTITLAGDTFAANVVSGNLITASNLPAGLTASFTRTSDTQISVTLTGNATNHANSNDISNLGFSFANGAFVSTASAANVSGSVRNDLAVNFNDPPTLSYSGTTFYESSANNGAIRNTVTITLANDTFSGTDGDNLIATGKVAVTNVPAGLTAVVTRTSSTTATLALSSNATSHTTDISNLTVTFLNGAFTNTTAAANVTGYLRNDLVVDFDAAAPALSYTGSPLSESAANDGTVAGSITITLANDAFTGVNGDNLVTAGKVAVTNVPAGLTAVVTRTSSTTATLTLTGTASAHANANDLSALTVTFGDSAFASGSAAAVTDATKNNLAVNFNDPPALSYSGNTFSESGANNGAISTSITITLTDDTFAANVVSSNLIAAANLPAGLTASFTRTSDTEITATLTGNATSHANANDISNLTFTFGDGAFTNTATAANVTGYRKSDLVVDFANPPALSYSGTTFYEALANNGSISNTITITLTGDTFDANVVSGNLITATNVPAGLTASFTRTSSTEITVTLTGNATNHANANDISNLTFTFANGAFTNTATAANVTGYLTNNLVVDFDAAPTLIYSGSTLTEAAANNGTISNTITITLANDTFTGSNGDNLITGGKVSVTNVPAGLTAVITRTSSTTATLTLTGTATSHTNANDISNLTVAFGDTAFTGGSASAITNATRNNLVVDFANPPALSYSSGTLSEAGANDGSVSTTITITLNGDTFTGSNGDNLVTGGKVSVTNVPAGLTAVVTRTGSTTATLTLTGTATSHANANDISNLTVAFGNTAFTGGSAAAISNATKNNLVVDFADPSTSPPPASYSAILDPTSDTGARDSVTATIEPKFTLNAGNLLTTGGSARLLAPDGSVIGSAAVTAADIAAGRISVPTDLLDDGVYTFTSQILDAAGNVVGSAPVTVTIVTDRDGVAPSVELAANNGDFNRDGIKDWLQNNVAQLPLTSMLAYNAGKDAPATSFGAVMAGNVNVKNLAQAVQLDAGAQLVDVFLSDLPTIPLPAAVTAVTPLFDFTVTSATNTRLTDIDPARAGLQTRVTIDLPTGVLATAFVKYNATTGTWTDFANLASLKGSGDGAALIDTNNDGRVDRIIVTLTDGGPGDEDGLVNGTIIDPGALAVTDILPVYSLLQKKKETPMAVVAKSIDSRLDFYVTTANDPDTVALKAWQNKLTGDYFYAPEGTPLPYRCYVERPDINLGRVYEVGEGAFDVHLYLNKKGRTELMSQDAATQANLIGLGYKDMGAIFGSADPIASLFGQ